MANVKRLVFTESRLRYTGIPWWRGESLALNKNWHGVLNDSIGTRQDQGTLIDRDLVAEVIGYRLSLIHI